METRLATSTKKLAISRLEDKENHHPEEKTTKKSDEKKIEKFPVPKTGDDGPREPLSTRVVNTMPAYMRATASSSVKNTKRNVTGKIYCI